MTTELTPVRLAPKRLAHVALCTNQLPAMIAWYREFLCARAAYATDEIAFLTYDGEHHRIALIANQTFPPGVSGRHVGHIHTAFAFDTLGELLGTFLRLREAGIHPRRSIIHGPTVSFYYADPDGNQNELQVDSFPDPEITNAWMRSEAFARNPIGVEFDPDEMIARYRAGVPDVELMRRPDTIAQGQ